MTNFPEWAENKIKKIIKGHANDTDGVSISHLYTEVALVVRPENLPKSLLMIAHKRETMRVIKSILKEKLPGNVVGAIKARFPKEIAEVLGDATGWIALGRGCDAPWTPALHATADQWAANARMKRSVSRAIADAAYRSEDIARYLSNSGAERLTDLMQSKAA